MASGDHFLGIDLGTTNSAQAVSEGDQVLLVRNPEGGVLTPSVVRIDGRGRLSVGARARSFLVKDPENTRSEFKRLMGSSHVLEFPAAGVRRTPPELAAEVLKALRQDFSDQMGYEPRQAVISVPALFELPQVAATSEAARLAGFERVEFIQEPIASAIAAGWSAGQAGGSWLVYDLGGGTFDASLLESREGLLRVVGHDGDNFLGGRDIDQALVDWAIGELATSGTPIDVRNPKVAPALRRLRAACEVAKIELTRATEADIVLEGLFEVDGKDVDVDLVLKRSTLEDILAPLIDRSLAVCDRLLSSHGLTVSQLERVVLVGGPTVIPAVKARLAARLGVDVAQGHDPMTVVAQGAALFALGQALDTKPSRAAAPTVPNVWLQYQAVCSDLHPYVVGKVSETGGAENVRSIVLRRADGGWSSPEVPLDGERAFATPVELLARSRATFKVVGLREDHREVALQPAEFTVVHGVSVGDPPLSRTIGVALADNDVRVFFERGSPLPVRRSFTLRTVEAVSPGNPGFALSVPIVQGEFPFAHLCRLVGALEISADAVNATVPAGSAVELTLELDRGGRMLASARIPCIERYFEHVAHLVVPELTIAAMQTMLDELLRRANSLRGGAFRGGDPKAAAALQNVESHVQDARRSIELATGGDPDASERARRLLVDLDGALSEVEMRSSWPKLREEATHKLTVASRWIGKFGTPVERDLFSKTAELVERAIQAKNGIEVRRQLDAARGLGDTAYMRSPDAWNNELQHAADRLMEYPDPLRAKELIEQGRRAAASNDAAGLEKAVRDLWRLRPADREERRLGYNSGVR